MTNMSVKRQLEFIEKHIKDRAPERMQSDIAQVFRDMASQKITPNDGLNEIQRIKDEVKR